MKEYTLDGEKYRFSGKRWVDSNGVAAPSGLYGRLNSLLLQGEDLSSKDDIELLNYASNVKEGENYSLAIRAMEILIDRADADIVKSVLPRLTSCYRKMGRIEEAIEIAESYLTNPALKMASNALFTSLGAAYCDIEEYSKARECANRAYAMSAAHPSPELKSLYGRINQLDETYTWSTENEQIKGMSVQSVHKVEEPIIILQETKKIEFSKSAEREAMNRIWKAIPISDREKYYDDFEIVCNSLKAGELTLKEE